VRPERLFFSAGEASGDAYAAELARRCRANQMVGVGGNLSEAAGIKVVARSDDWGAMGIFEAFKVSFRVLRGYRLAKRELRRGEPGWFVPIDYGFLNIKLAKYAKGCGWKVFYFIPPGSWRKTKQGSDLPAITDKIVTPFEWSAQILSEMGANVRWMGHPLHQMVSQVPEPSERQGIAILPGSRRQEIESNLEAIVPAVSHLPGPFRLVPAPNVSPDDLLFAWLKHGGAAPELIQPARVALKQCRAAVVCSGTATLEAALARCPMTVIYRGNKIQKLEYKIRKPKFDHIALPNILLGRRAFPEAIADEASEERIRHDLDMLLADSPERQAQLAAMDEVEALCGGVHAIDEAAIWLMEG
jgi:lipid-A-disaccharide synthase